MYESRNKTPTLYSGYQRFDTLDVCFQKGKKQGTSSDALLLLDFIFPFLEFQQSFATLLEAYSKR